MGSNCAWSASVTASETSKGRPTSVPSCAGNPARRSTAASRRTVSAAADERPEVANVTAARRSRSQSARRARSSSQSKPARCAAR